VQTCYIHTPIFAASKKRKCIIYFHGGGIVLGSAENYRNIASKLAFYTNFVIINCNYRLCPEVKFPLPVYDAYAIVKDILLQAEELEIDRDRVCLMGESAAAGLIMAVAQEMVKRNEMHLIKLMVPISIFGDHLVSGKIPYEQWT
jgi:acetyl esterase